MDSFSEIWSAACDYMKEALNVSDVAFNLWISPLVPESFDGQTAKFTCPTSYKIQIITYIFHNSISPFLFIFVFIIIPDLTSVHYTTRSMNHYH